MFCYKNIVPDHKEPKGMGGPRRDDHPDYSRATHWHRYRRLAGKMPISRFLTSGLPVIPSVGPDWSFVPARESVLYRPAICGTVSAVADINLC
jgi:hypothetical protein